MGACTVNQPPGHNFENVDYNFINEYGKVIAWGYECAYDFNEAWRLFVWMVNGAMLTSMVMCKAGAYKVNQGPAAAMRNCF